LQVDPVAGERLLSIDIEALAELLENIHLSCRKLGRSDDFLHVVDSMGSVIADSRWSTKIAYARGLWHLVHKDDAKAALQELSSIDISTCADPDVLTLYLDVSRDSLGFTETFEVIDRILQNTRKESVRLQYRVIKALKYYLICQPAEGRKIFENALSAFRELPEEKKSAYGKYQFAHALETYGTAESKRDILEEGRTTVQTLIEEADGKFTNLHFADLHKLLGDIEAALENYDSAIAAYSNSLLLNRSPLTEVFFARVICKVGRRGESRELLQAIDDTVFQPPERFDLAISWATLAATSLDHEDIGEATTRLKSIKASDPLFIQLRDQWLIELLEVKAQTRAAGGSLRNLLRSLNKYVILRPNIFGIGIDLNRVISDAEEEG
jgi:tetratricopeptide (TPR) repeat protein